MVVCVFLIFFNTHSFVSGNRQVSTNGDQLLFRKRHICNSKTRVDEIKLNVTTEELIGRCTSHLHDMDAYEEQKDS